ncbi:hypothetical protein [Streptomyces sp. NPDC017940]|uniref:effector-associated constant component EACC1 n=1 Tax=Streptomyces sp. NPDC017940 TaxID=3365017 RepID=UPI003796E5B9
MAGAEAELYVTLVRGAAGGVGGAESNGPPGGAGDTGGLGSLLRWLGADPELTGVVRTDSGAGAYADVGAYADPDAAPGTSGLDGSHRPSGPSGPTGHMGDAIEIINLVVSNSLALVSVLTSVLSWRQSRPAAPEIRLVLADGRTLIVDQDTVDQLRARGSTGSPSSTGNTGDTGSTDTTVTAPEPPAAGEPQ